jgi:polysaccharide pyruvyl transferase CsaB
LFQDRTGNLSLYYYLALILVAGLMGKRTVLYSVGVNGLRAMNRRMTARIINATDIVTVRDRESGRLLSNWGVATEKIKIVADPVLQYGALKKHAAGAEPVIAFILRPGGNQPERAAEAVARVAAAVREKLGAKIVFIPFQERYDQPFTKTVAALTGEGTTIVEWNDPEEVIRQIEGVDLVVSQRFHGLVLAVLAGIPPVGISEDVKVQRFMEEIGRPCFTGFKDCDAVLSFITESWQQKDTISRKMTEIRQQLEERAHETAGFIARVFAE